MMINKIKAFRGIALCPFKLNLNRFNGYAITILSFEYQTQGKISLLGSSWCLLHIGFHDSIDDSFIFSLNILGWRKKWFIKPRLINTCPNCKSKISIYGELDGELYCDECCGWINKNEIEVIKLYREGKA